MTDQQIRDEFSKLVISKINGSPYEEVAKMKEKWDYKPLSITFGRLIAAINITRGIEADDVYWYLPRFDWKFLNDDGSECTHETQDINTIKLLIKLLK